jgi:putative N6-adenine-specific DNA methylase
MYNDTGTFDMVATTMHGLEDILKAELESLGATEVETSRRAVTFKGDKEVMYRANFHSRLSLRIIIPIYHEEIRNAQDLYNAVYNIEWEKIIDAEQTLAVDTLLNSDLFTHSNFPSLKAKDAVVDRFRKQGFSRPGVDRDRPDLRIHLRIQNEDLYISLDSSGESLNRRGYREEGFKAPMNEVLAAGLITLSGWDRKKTLLDPMCGSGTLLIEAGMMARRIPPGSLREYFAFTHWKDFDRKLFRQVKEFRPDPEPEIIPDIYGYDKDNRALQDAQANLRRAGLTGFIRLEKGKFGDYKLPDNEGFIIMNPPYGQRMQPDDIEGLYSEIGSVLKHQFTGYEAWILSSNKEAMAAIGLKSKRKIPVYNGSLECRFTGYELFEGKA